MDNPEEIFTYLEGAKNRLKYDHSVAHAKLLHQTLLPKYLKDREVYYTIYTKVFNSAHVMVTTLQTSVKTPQVSASTCSLEH